MTREHITTTPDAPLPDFRMYEGLKHDENVQAERHLANHEVAKKVLRYGVTFMLGGLAVFGIHGAKEGFDTVPDSAVRLEEIGALIGVGGFTASKYQKRAAEAHQSQAREYNKKAVMGRYDAILITRKQLIREFPEKGFKPKQIERIIRHPSFNPRQPNAVDVHKIIKDKKKKK